MQKHMLTAALIAAATLAGKQAKQKGGDVTIKVRPDYPEVRMAEPMDLHRGDSWRRRGKQRGRRAT